MVRRAFPWDPGALFLGLSKWQPGTFEILANSLASWGPRGWEGGGQWTGGGWKEVACLSHLRESAEGEGGGYTNESRRGGRKSGRLHLEQTMGS